MLKLKNIKKEYISGTNKVMALKNISLEFRASEFVSILGPSGCGKTTMLNIIGGLDRYSGGDLLIDGKTTDSFSESEWDAYRNYAIGFVFQNYNLIPHLNVLENVVIALTLAGISVGEKTARAKKILEEVGLSDQFHKKPNQLSGGQMQRVSIARALVNNPKILLADEPTGALDSKTSIQIMELIKRISKDRLVIMVTHNQKLASEYSNRIIELSDGEILNDSNPYTIGKESKKEKLISKKTSMSFFTALKLSFKNLMTKRKRTLITSFAGSIGIIGIALVLAISSGMTTYVDAMQSDTLAGFPITITKTTEIDRSTLSLGGKSNEFDKFPKENEIFSYNSDDYRQLHENIFTDEYLSYLNSMNDSFFNAITYSRGISLNVASKMDSGNFKRINTRQSTSLTGQISGYFTEMPNSEDFIKSQYDYLVGEYSDKKEDIVLIIDKYNRLNVRILEDWGIDISTKYSFEDFIGREFKVIKNNDNYRKENNLFTAKNLTQQLYDNENNITLKISAILRVKETSSSEILSRGIGYSTSLTDYMLEDCINSDVVIAQKENISLNLISGNPFTSTQTHYSLMNSLGAYSIPTGIQIYPKSFDTKAKIKQYLDLYNEGKDEGEQLIYTDLAETIVGGISRIIDAITLVLSSVAAISLVVSSIMIGIITYVSVVERTKEIGILRALGARKKDISRVFNAETIIIGFAAGVIGILFTFIFSIPINIIANNLVGVPNIAKLPLLYGVLLIIISMSLTLIAGFIPSKIAAKKDPVVALRTE